jgi:D-alanyl-D-alanine carboxypeptidase/D-alanyl-D-alanine-endopeptidase (penicillin-binding protein 4)
MIKRTRIISLLALCLFLRVAAFAQAPKTVAELQTRISEILAKPELAPAMVGIKVVSLDTGRVLFEENAAKLLRPASNMKMYTVAAALDKLTPDGSGLVAE